MHSFFTRTFHRVFIKWFAAVRRNCCHIPYTVFGILRTDEHLKYVQSVRENMRLPLQKPSWLDARYALPLWAGIAILFLSCPAVLATGEEDSAAKASAPASSFQPAIRKTTEDIGRIREQLNQLRGEIQNKRETLLEDISRCREQTEKLQTRIDNQQHREEELEREVEKLRKDIATAGRVLSQGEQILLNARRELPAHLHTARAGSLRPELQKVMARLEKNEPEAAATAKAWREFSVLAQKTLEDTFGGTTVKGRAVGPAGRETKGVYLLAGPAADFLSTDKPSFAGPAFTNEESPLPAVYTDVKEKKMQKIKNLVSEGKQADVPFDPTLGRAAQFAETKKSLVQHLKQGRLIMIPLLVLGGACVFFTIYKLISLFGMMSRRADERIAAILEALHRGEPDTARNRAQSLPRPLSAVIREGITHCNAPKDQLEEVMREQMLSQRPSLERFLSPLAVVASAAPLLGLLGTVTGMIHTFRLITVFGSGKADVLSSGISEALVTTEVGLIIAVPSLLLHAWFSRRVRRALALTRQSAVMFVNGLKHSSVQ